MSGDRVHATGVYERFATNYELQAAVAAAQLERLEGIATTRARNGNLLSERIRGAPGVEPHGVDEEDRSTYWFYLFRLRLEAHS